jgi:hypothetical protein
MDYADYLSVDPELEHMEEMIVCLAEEVRRLRSATPIEKH